MRRYDVASTSIRRHFDAMCPLGKMCHFYPTGLHIICHLSHWTKIFHFCITVSTGMSESTWDLRILDDGLLENTESIAIYIQQPVNAVLGRRRKMRIRLINAEDGNDMNL